MKENVTFFSPENKQRNWTYIVKESINCIIAELWLLCFCSYQHAWQLLDLLKTKKQKDKTLRCIYSPLGIPLVWNPHMIIILADILRRVRIRLSSTLYMSNSPRSYVRGPSAACDWVRSKLSPGSLNQSGFSKLHPHRQSRTSGPRLTKQKRKDRNERRDSSAAGQWHSVDWTSVNVSVLKDRTLTEKRACLY